MIIWAPSAKRDILALYRDDIMKIEAKYQSRVLSIFDQIPAFLSQHEKRVVLSDRKIILFILKIPRAYCMINHTKCSCLTSAERGIRILNLYPYIKSIIDTDQCAIVVCSLSHEIIYMNPAAIRSYAKWGGDQLIGKNLLACHNETSRQMIQKVTDWFSQSESHNRIYTHHNEKQNKDVYMVALRGEDGELIGYYEKHEYRAAETDALYDFGGA